MSLICNCKCCKRHAHSVTQIELPRQPINIIPLVIVAGVSLLIGGYYGAWEHDQRDERGVIHIEKEQTKDR